MREKTSKPARESPSPPLTPPTAPQKPLQTPKPPHNEAEPPPHTPGPAKRAWPNVHGDTLAIAKIGRKFQTKAFEAENPRNR